MEEVVTHVNPKFASFQPDKAIAAIGYLIDRTHETLYPLMKMMYLADRLHLRRYGRFISGDTYTAMSEGPVPSITYDLMKHVRGDRKYVPGTDRAEAAFSYVHPYVFTLRSEPAYDELSASDIECLGEVVSLLNSFGCQSIVNMSHDEAWANKRKGLRAFMRTCDMSIEDIASHQENAEVLLAHLRDTHPGSA